MSTLTYECEPRADRQLTEGMAPEDTHAVYAEDDEGQMVGRLLWNPATGVVEWVMVEIAWRRQGIATRLWREATMQAIVHGLAQPRQGAVWTGDGRAWLRSL